ncbi:MAG: hypothetical protein HYS12_24920 [Planctomycetes bacterium]|nr:hypothetical protein [Planctomycetota bacterium]
MTATRAPLALVFACLAALTGPATLRGEENRPIEIEDIRIGFPAQDGRRCRPGSWCPVHVDLRARGALAAGEYELAVETADSDDVLGQYVVSVPAVAAGNSSTVRTYYRPGNRTASLKAIVRKKGAATLHALEKAPGFNETLRPEEVLYLAIGGRPARLRNALVPARKGGQETGEQDEALAERGIVVVDKPDELPDRWFGYAGVDVVVLSTGSGMAGRLLDSRWAVQGAALGEWVRRGGRLVVDLGKNARDAAELLRRWELQVGQPRVERSRGLQELQEWVGVSNDPFPGEQGADVARFRLADAAVALVSDRVGEESWPVVSLAACGLGRVLLVAFDLDAPTFAAWKGRGRFWEVVHAELGPRQATRGRGQETGERPEELGTLLQRGLENFDRVPAVSFGWVAFFMLLYILLIGPLDYLFLKKVVKRLELTWVSFPVVVLVASLAAFWTAHGLKGGELRINKIDVVDIDLRAGEVQGTTWFALFSPRVECYTIGVEAAPTWVPRPASDSSVMVTTLSPPDSSAGGIDRPGSQPVFRRPYVYAKDGAGLKNVAVPVWASRSFTATWRAGVGRNTPVAVEDFGLSRDGLRLVGRLQSRLPVALREVSLFYNGNWYALEELPAGGSYRVDVHDIPRTAQGSPVPWMNELFGRSARGTAEGRPRAAEVTPPMSLMKTVLFHGLEGGPYSHLANSGLRLLDQGWRLRGLKGIGRIASKQYLDEAIIVGRAVVPVGVAEVVDRNGISATHLWLGALPGGERPELEGVMSQETYVRIYVPIPRDPEEEKK